MLYLKLRHMLYFCFEFILKSLYEARRFLKRNISLINLSANRLLIISQILKQVFKVLRNARSKHFH